MKMKHGNSKLAVLADTAIDAVRMLVVDPNTPPSVRLRAAKLILESITGPDKDGDDDNTKAMPVPAPAQQAHNPAPERPLGPTPVETQHSNLRPPPKVGRNDSCPCGSGLKFKKCCLGKFDQLGRSAPTQAARPVPLARDGAPAAA